MPLTLYLGSVEPDLYVCIEDLSQETLREYQEMDDRFAGRLKGKIRVLRRLGNDGYIRPFCPGILTQGSDGGVVFRFQNGRHEMVREDMIN